MGITHLSTCLTVVSVSQLEKYLFSFFTQSSSSLVHSQKPKMAEARMVLKPGDGNSIQVSYMDGRNMVTGAGTAATQGLHQQGARGRS